MIGLKVKNDKGEEKEYWEFWVEVDESTKEEKYIYTVIGEIVGTKRQDIIKMTYNIKEALSLKNELKEQYKKMIKGE